jgi:hypothetical protein
METTTFTLEITDASVLDAFTQFLHSNPSAKVTSVSHEPLRNTYSTKYCYVPTREFVAHCGSENLTHNGLISEAGAIDVIISYAKTNKLYYGGYIELNEYLQTLLNTHGCSTLTISALSDVLKGLFTQAS